MADEDVEMKRRSNAQAHLPADNACASTDHPVELGEHLVPISFFFFFSDNHFLPCGFLISSAIESPEPVRPAVAGQERRWIELYGSKEEYVDRVDRRKCDPHRGLGWKGWTRDGSTATLCSSFHHHFAGDWVRKNPIPVN